MKKTNFLAVFCMALLVSTSIFASRADNHAPIGVMGDHSHLKNEIMGSYRFMYMNMDGARTDNDSISTEKIWESYSMAPESMSMSMHMLGGMYALSDKLTFMGMTHLVQKSMTMRMKMGKKESSMETSGLSDLSVSALYTFKKTDHSTWLGTLGINVPMGSISETGSDGKRLAYPMQLGSGTLDITLGTTWTHTYTKWSEGHQLTTLLRTGQNEYYYRLGHQARYTYWLARSFSPALSVSGRFSMLAETDISGSDSSLMTAMSPTASTDTGKLVSTLSLGANYMFSAGSRAALEISKPVIQKLDNIQLETDLLITAGFQHVF